MQADPDGAGAAAPFSLANPDFTLRSLRGNAVYRWEFEPGSVLHVAWTHSRTGQDQQATCRSDATSWCSSPHSPTTCFS